MSTLRKEYEEHRQRSKAGWYYCAEFGVFHGIRYLGESDYSPDAWAGNIWGPFPTFSAARQDAIQYFRTDIETARTALREVEAYRKGDSHE